MFNTWVMLSAIADKPLQKRFFIRHRFSIDQYEVQVSDLQTVWSEKMSRRSTIKRAFEIDSPIDPTDPPSQLQSLLEYIKAALDSSDSKKVRITNATRSKVELLAISPLTEAGLVPLEWPMTLEESGDSSIITEMITPLLAVSFSRRQQLTRMSELMIEKDAAIAKLLEKIESAGVDLATIFPNAAAGRKSRGSMRSHIIQSIRGLQPYDNGKWRPEENVASHSLPIDTVIKQAFEETDDPEIQRVCASINISQSTNDSGSSLEETRRANGTMIPRAKELDQPQQNNQTAADDDDDDDEFQRQATPPRLHQSKKREADAVSPRLVGSAGKRNGLGKLKGVEETHLEPSPDVMVADDVTDEEDEETEGEDDLDAPFIQSSASAYPEEPSDSTVTAGGPSSNSPRKASPRGSITANEKAATKERENLAQIRQSPNIVAMGEQKPLSSRSGLGALKSRARADDFPHVSNTSAPVHPEEKSVSIHSRSPRGKLGRLGARNVGAAAISNATPRSQDAAEEPTHGIVTETPMKQSSPEELASPEATKPRETSRDRADKRREELEAELEKKSRAPQKKKRKF